MPGPPKSAAGNSALHSAKEHPEQLDEAGHHPGRTQVPCPLVSPIETQPAWTSLCPQQPQGWTHRPAIDDKHAHEPTTTPSSPKHPPQTPTGCCTGHLKTPRLNCHQMPSRAATRWRHRIAPTTAADTIPRAPVTTRPARTPNSSVSQPASKPPRACPPKRSGK